MASRCGKVSTGGEKMEADRSKPPDDWWVCSSSLDLNNSFIEDSVRLLESFFSILMSDFRWGNEAIWLASCNARWPRLTRIKLDECLTSLAILEQGRTNLDGKGFGDPQVQTSYRREKCRWNSSDFDVLHGSFNLSLIYPTTLEPAFPSVLLLTPWKPWTGNPNIYWVYQFSYWKFTAMCWNLLSCIRWVFSQYQLQLPYDTCRCVQYM